MNRIRVNNIDINYRFDGPRDATVLMMAHAMGTSHRLWDWQVPALTDRYQLLRYDWRGHGDSSAPPGPYTLTQFVEDAVGLMDALSIDKVHWIGISTGGMIGQGLAISYQNRLKSLSLCNTTSESNAWYRNWVAERQEVVRSHGMSPVWDMTKRLWFTDAFVDAANDAYRAVRDVFVRTPVLGYLGGTSAVADLAYHDDLHRITVPTQIIAAGDDPATPVEHSQVIHARIAHSSLVVLDGQRHFSNVEVPDKFNRALRSGLDQMTLVAS